MKRITCTGCSLLCDDIIVEQNDDGGIEQIIGACLRGDERFKSIKAQNRILNPLIRENDELKETQWNLALQKTIQLIKDSSNPLLYGFSTTSCEAQAEGIRLARAINGFIDSNSTICQGITLDKSKKTGVTMTTITEIINKGDIILLWGFNPIESIPRLLNKVLFSRGKFRMTGREIKTLIVIDPVETASYKIMGPRDIPLLIKPASDLELIQALKKICKEEMEIPKEGIAGIDKMDLDRLVANLVDSENISILIGQGILQPRDNGDLLKELLELVEILNSVNEKGRISLIMGGGHFNMTGFDQTALSLTGKNHSLQFKENTLIDSKDNIITKIENDDFDLSIIVGTDPISHLPLQISKKLASKPMILLDNRKNSSYYIADVVLPTAITGVETGGTAFRIDDVPLKLSKLIDPPNDLPSDEELLTKINKEFIEG
jgi:formylmethanofuran dehydrogenase subunit B